MAGRLSILIAEDSAADRMLLSTIVSRQGHRVLTAGNGLEAVGLFEQERPQLVLMDALMPVMDGFDAARRIKEAAGEALVPIIFLTSLTENEALVRCLEVGDDFLAKPYNPIILEAKIHAMDRLRRLQQTVVQQRDLIAKHNEHLMTEQRVAKAHYTLSYWWWSYDFPAGTKTGTWRFDATFNGRTYSHEFTIGTPTEPLALDRHGFIPMVAGQ